MNRFFILLALVPGIILEPMIPQVPVSSNTAVIEEEQEQIIDETIVNITETEQDIQKSVSSIVYTNVVYKTPYETYTYATLDEAKENINISILSDSECNLRAIENKNKYACEAEKVLELLNEYRRENGLSEVVHDDTIATAAMHRAVESAYADWNMTAYENGIIKRHIRPNFEKASTILDYYGLTGSYGENYGRYQDSPEEIINDWKASSSHNSLMLGNYTRAGIGVAQDSEGYYYWILLLM